MSQTSNSSPLRKYLCATNTPYTLNTIKELVEGWKNEVDQYGILHTFVNDEQSIEELRANINNLEGEIEDVHAEYHHMKGDRTPMPDSPQMTQEEYRRLVEENNDPLFYCTPTASRMHTPIPSEDSYFETPSQVHKHQQHTNTKRPQLTLAIEQELTQQEDQSPKDNDGPETSAAGSSKKGKAPMNYHNNQTNPSRLTRVSNHGNNHLTT